MENKMMDKLGRSFSLEMPEPQHKTLNGYLRAIIPEVRPWGEDLYEMEYYVDKPWMEIRDDVNFHDTVLHFFNEGGQYMNVTNGNIRGGGWEFMESANKFILNANKSNAMYNLAYLDSNFFILQKHGTNEFFVMGYEPVVKGLEWRDAMELLYNQYRSNNNSYVSIALIMLVIIALIVALSFF